MLATLSLTLALIPKLEFAIGAFPLVPGEPLSLGGYTARRGAPSEPGGDTLYLRTLLLKQGQRELVFAVVDQLTIPESLRDEVRKRLPSGVECMLIATHTHCAPDSQRLNRRMTIPVPGIATFQEKWLNWVADQIAKGIRSTLNQRRKPVDQVGTLRAQVSLNRGRRTLASPDRTVTALLGSAHDREHAWNRLLTIYAAHPVLYGQEERKFRGDWPGEVARRTQAPVVTGAIGDVSPAADGENSAEKVNNFANRLEGALAALKVPEPIGEPRLDYSEVPIALDKVMAHPDFARENRIDQRLAAIVVGTFAPTTAFVSVMRLGKLALVGIPGEPSAELGRRIAESGRRAGFNTTVVLSHVNGWIGYILEPWDYDRGEYEATLGFHGRETANRVAEAAEQALKTLAKRPLAAMP